MANAQEGAWIFLSHSNQDFDRVRELRNDLEDRGHRPLMFFLKSLEQDAEIFGLIEREIKARSWFVLCDSENARKSEWVQREREIIKGLPRDSHTYREVDLDDPHADVLDEVQQLVRNASVFLSYSQHDKELAQSIRDVLLEQDFAVFWAEDDLSAGEEWADRFSEELEKAVTQGAVLVLLSHESIQSVFVVAEVRRALTLAERMPPGRSHVIPIFTSDPSTLLEMLPRDVQEALERIHGVPLLDPADVEPIRDLAKEIRTFDWVN